MGHRDDLLVTHNLSESKKSQLPTSPTRQRPPRQRLRSDGPVGNKNIATELPTNRELAKDELPFFRATIESCQTAEPNQSSTGVREKGNAYFCNSDSGLPLRFTEFNDNGDLVRPLPRNRYLRAGNCFPVLVRERHR